MKILKTTDNLTCREHNVEFKRTRVDNEVGGDLLFELPPNWTYYIHGDLSETDPQMSCVENEGQGP